MLNREVFFDKVRGSVFRGTLNQQQVEGMNRILDEWELRVSVNRFSPDQRWLAYLLATVYWETAHKMVPVREMGGEAYLKTKKYYPWVGEGLVQVTWEANARKFGAKKPGDCMSWPIALEAAFKGMKDGMFTGKKLAHYFNGTEDPVGARRIINGTDKAQEIAAIYRHFLLAIKTAWVDTPDEVPLPPERPDMADKPEPIEFDPPVFEEPAPVSSPKSDPAPPEVIVKGDSNIWHIQRRLKAMNYSPGDLDGRWGGATGGAIAGFINDRKLDLPAPTSVEMFGDILPSLRLALAYAEAERFVRPVSVERAEATPADVAKKVEAVKETRAQKFWAWILGIPAAIWASFKGIVDNIDEAYNSEWANHIKEFFADNMILFALGLVGLAGWMWWKAKRAENLAVKAYKEGRIL